MSLTPITVLSTLTGASARLKINPGGSSMGGPDRLISRRGGRGNRSAASRLLALGILALALVQASLPPQARAAAEEDRLLSITKLTLYGAVLGGLLGTCTALVVDKDSRGDAIRWGVAAGAFGGFIYGVAAPRRGSDELDEDLSMLRCRTHRGTEGRLAANSVLRNRITDGPGIPISIHMMNGVHHDGCQEQAEARNEDTREGDKEGEQRGDRQRNHEDR
jgi:hypothetical protein